MKSNKLIPLIKKHINLECVVDYEMDKYDCVSIILPDSGKINVKIEPKTRNCVPFLIFNTRLSELRLKKQDEYTGKHNYFGEYPEKELELLLFELSEIISKK